MNSKNQRRNSVLLIHGIEDTGAVFNKMGSYLRQSGWCVYTLDLVPNNGSVGLDILAQQVADYVVNTFGAEEPMDLVGFSMGGIVGRYYVQRLGGINRVQRFITISSPHHGTMIAYGSQRYGCLQMRPNSPFIQDLNADAVMLGQINFTSIWTPYDLMIVPANSSQMPMGKEVVLPVALHPWMLTDGRICAAVASALADSVKPHHQFRYTDDHQKSPLGGGNI
ncbi:lipase family alpha/beta hydrolase [Umezakia ovalisporum]|jgi:triacylglycerol lipase|uniref:Alpha/beta fold hydrolase n=1 Tax=Umezakia ovalisporum FSS-62 TaxID=2971776 RepID=A0AA43KEB4_9CYAN|nr:alpha/beta fold hydrolase [Umezakia ovalisporum]MBI1242924.1 alpha/beta fold hydrolase [Nostoc sp. RI_552]MDH6063222.1 alpha/beta fold hydrolase [Umezakia ovalisporum FSS-62]MDH6068890.1 alpha/beta fold hydrolase [Umezakia ovalisporum APH033B]MDH6079593.1 alpha/beta fold hydrolase [Umezakia ovalisporum FSS-45]MDH6085525.1 alpha/beta fold hydrolase [Umezakia ovalisporum TAC611]